MSSIYKDSTFKNYSFLRAFHNTKSQNKTQMCCNLNKKKIVISGIFQMYTPFVCFKAALQTRY